VRDFFWTHVLVPMFWFVFEFIGDRWWLMAIIAVLLAILVWRFLMPWVRGFHALFGWYGWATLHAAVASFGVFGAGWRAHRDSVSGPGPAEQGGGDPDIRKPRPRRVAVPDLPSDYAPFGAPENTPKPKRKR
jgi:hypothetical protein